MEIKNEILEEILPLVRKPARYLGNELNAVRKDPRAKGKIRYLFSRPLRDRDEQLGPADYLRPA